MELPYHKRELLQDDFKYGQHVAITNRLYAGHQLPLGDFIHEVNVENALLAICRIILVDGVYTQASGPPARLRFAPLA